MYRLRAHAKSWRALSANRISLWRVCLLITQGGGMGRRDDRRGGHVVSHHVSFHAHHDCPHYFSGEKKSRRHCSQQHNNTNRTAAHTPKCTRHPRQIGGQLSGRSGREKAERDSSESSVGSFNFSEGSASLILCLGLFYKTHPILLFLIQSDRRPSGWWSDERAGFPPTSCPLSPAPKDRN